MEFFLLSMLIKINNWYNVNVREIAKEKAELRN